MSCSPPCVCATCSAKLGAMWARLDACTQPEPVQPEPVPMCSELELDEPADLRRYERSTLRRDAPGGHFNDCIVAEGGEVFLCHCPLAPVQPDPASDGEVCRRRLDALAAESEIADGSVSLVAPTLGVGGTGATRREALDDLADSAWRLWLGLRGERDDRLHESARRLRDRLGQIFPGHGGLEAPVQPEPASHCSGLELDDGGPQALQCHHCGRRGPRTQLKSQHDGLSFCHDHVSCERRHHERRRLAREAKLAAQAFEPPDPRAVTAGDLIGLRREDCSAGPSRCDKSRAIVEAESNEQVSISSPSPSADGHWLRNQIAQAERLCEGIAETRFGDGGMGHHIAQMRAELDEPGREKAMPGYALCAALQAETHVPALARHFGVSDVAMARRLNEYFRLGVREADLPPVTLPASAHEPRGNCLRTVAWIAAIAFALAFTLVLASCSQSHTSLEEKVLVATLTAWDETGLPAPRESCRIEAFRIEYPRTVAAFQRACSGLGRQATEVRAWACLRWRLESPRVRTIVYPSAVLSPLLEQERWAAGALHELLHALSMCALADADPDHLDGRIWQGGADSVQARAMAALAVP